MSFIGAIASSIRQALANYSADVNLPCLLIGAGNFTAASVLRSGGYKTTIKSCDVSLYTSVLGSYLSDTELDISEKPDVPKHLAGLLDISSPLKAAVTVALIYDLREVWQLKNPFQERVFYNYKSHWTELVESAEKKLQIYKKHIGNIEYRAQDGFDFLQEHNPDHTVFAFPPTYKRGYEKLEKLLRATIQWTAPIYREMTDQSLELYESVADYKAYFVVLEKELPDVYNILGYPAAILPRGRGNHTYIIAKKPKKTFVIRKITKSESVGQTWPPENPVTGKEKLSFAVIKLAQSIRLNELYLSSKVDYFSGGVGISLGFFLNNRIIGKVDFAPSAHQWKLPDEKSMIYVMSDLAVASNTKRLSKLILLCLLSKEIKEILNMKYVEDFGYAITTAFSNYPVSMKYRGIFKLHKRKKLDKGYMLNYFAPFGEYMLFQALKIWKEKYNKKNETAR
jgi:hypothetical protein